MPGFLQSLEAMSQALPAVPDDVLESQLVTFDMFVNLEGASCRATAAGLLRDAAQQCTQDSRRNRLIDAADAVAAGKPCALTPEGLTAQQAAAASTAEALPDASVWDFFPGLAVRVVQTFRDFDGQEIATGQTLRLLSKSHFFYDDGHTLTFDWKQIRLSGDVPEEEAIIANAGNAYFEPVPDIASMQDCWRLIDERWKQLDMTGQEHAALIRSEIDECGRWLQVSGERGSAPVCLSAGFTTAFPHDPTNLGWRIAYLFAGIRRCG
jgi:hypothetical protein